VANWLRSNIYLAAQLAVLPLALVWLYHRSPAVYQRLRNTVIGAWLIAVPMFALYPVAPPTLAGIGIPDTVSHHAAVALTGRSPGGPSVTLSGACHRQPLPRRRRCRPTRHRACLHSKAFGIWGSVVGSGAAVGLLLGGALTEYLSRRWCSTRTSSSQFPRRPPHLRWCATNRMAGRGSTYPGPWRRAGLFALVYLVVGVGMFGAFFFLTFYLQQTLGFSPIETGVAFLPLIAAVMITAQPSSQLLLPRIGPRPLVPTGMLVRPQPPSCSHSPTRPRPLRGPGSSESRCGTPADGRPAGYELIGFSPAPAILDA
jgi:PAP2 superfamily